MNQEQIKHYASLIVDNSISIIPYENGNQIEFKYAHNQIIQSVIHKNKYKYKHEYDDQTILRDETYASYYESLLKLIEKENYTESDMDIISEDINTGSHEITQNFIRLLKGYMNNNLKNYLIDPTRRDQSNNESHYITTRTIYDSDIYDYLEDSTSKGEAEAENEIYQPLYNLLTASQKEYITGERVYANKDTEKKVKQRIRKRVNDVTDLERDTIQEVKETREDIVNDILDIEDPNKFVMEIKRWQRKVWFSDIIAEYVPSEARRDFNKNKITNETIKVYRKSLFKSLNHAR